MFCFFRFESLRHNRTEETKNNEFIYFKKISRKWKRKSPTMYEREMNLRVILNHLLLHD